MTEASGGQDRARTAVVTGASRGLGAGLAESFAKAGLRLGLCSRSAPALPEGERVVAACVDVTDEDALDHFASRVEERFGRIHLWVNNAGVVDPIGPLRELDAVALRRHVDVNVTGVLLGTRRFVRHLHGSAAEGVLVNVTSGAATSAHAGCAAYCAAKAAVDRLTEVVQLEEEARGLRAYALAPGMIDTAMQARIRAQSEASFPAVERFRRAWEEGALNSPAYVARELLSIAFDPRRRPASVVVRIAPERG